jgi:hypothetical protein
MEDSYIYISVKLYLKDGQTEQSAGEIVQECDYSFTHDDILGHEIVDILDTQVAPASRQELLFPVDPFDMIGMPFKSSEGKIIFDGHLDKEP